FITPPLFSLRDVSPLYHTPSTGTVHRQAPDAPASACFTTATPEHNPPLSGLVRELVVCNSHVPGRFGSGW
ncbi:MAG: hypothetical protein ACODAD_11560, partial [Planctomycetota bacterium]